MKREIKGIKDFCLENRQDKYIAMTKFGATWENNTKKQRILFDKKAIS